jgi:hypothetical protein
MDRQSEYGLSGSDGQWARGTQLGNATLSMERPTHLYLQVSVRCQQGGCSMSTVRLAKIGGGQVGVSD